MAEDDDEDERSCPEDMINDSVEEIGFYNVPGLDFGDPLRQVYDYEKKSI